MGRMGELSVLLEQNYDCTGGCDDITDLCVSCQKVYDTYLVEIRRKEVTYE